MFLDLLGFFWSVSSIGQMVTLTDYDKYQYMFHGNLPDALLLVRYLGSWAQRILGLTAGIGLMAHRRWAANIINVLSVYNIITVFWKHPLAAVEKHCMLLDSIFDPTLTASGLSNIHFFDYAPQTTVFLRVFDIIFFGFTIYYLSRPQTKTRLK